ncbi:MAG: hypothetical protein ACRETQ_00540 [Gammaproteobacteria bacterium]
MNPQPRRRQSLAIALGLALLAAALCASAQAEPRQTPLPAPSKPAAAVSKTRVLAPVTVSGVAAIKAEVRALQEVKVALKRPVSSAAADANLTVCKIDHQARGVHVQERMGAILECGSNSWWLYVQDNCRMDGISACAEGLPSSAFKRKGMWHNFRALNLQQVMELRKLTGTLPPPGSTRTIIVTGYAGAPSKAPAATSKPR